MLVNFSDGIGSLKSIRKIFYVLFALMQKEPKKSSPARSFPIAIGTGQANAHEKSFQFANSFYYRSESLIMLLRAIRNIGRRCLFRLHSSTGSVIITGEKEGAGNFLLIEIIL